MILLTEDLLFCQYHENLYSKNTENTMEFVKYLQEQRPGKRQAIFGDGATYHNSHEFREYLMLINQDLPKNWV